MFAFVRYSRWAIAVYVAVALGCVSPRAQTKPIPHGDQRYTLTIPNLRLHPGERVVGFSVEVDSGRIVSAPNAPIGWNLTIDNDPSWRTNLTATVIVGAAALDARFFQDFVVIEKSSLGGMPFAVRCDVDVTKDWQSVRHIEVVQKDLVLRRTWR